MCTPEIDIIDVLEKRVEEIEKQLFGYSLQDEDTFPKPESTLVESLEHANTLISSALSGRENLNTLIARLPELEKLTENDFNSSELDPRVQLEYIVIHEKEIKDIVKRLNQFQELIPILDSDRYKNIIDKAALLNDVTLKYIKIFNDIEALKKETRDMLDRYNNTMTSLTKTILAVDSKLIDLERAAKPKKILDDIDDDDDDD